MCAKTGSTLKTLTPLPKSVPHQEFSGEWIAPNRRDLTPLPGRRQKKPLGFMLCWAEVAGEQTAFGSGPNL